MRDGEPTRRTAEAESPYDRIAALYDTWSRSVTEDVDFYVAEARKATGGARAARTGEGKSIVELGIGTGRIAVPTAAAGVRVIGIDSSPGMLEVCRRRAAAAGVELLVDLRLGDLRNPPVAERVPLVTCPFRSYLHLVDADERLAALRAARDLLLPGGRLIFDVFTPSADDIEETDARWLEREPGIWERADWDEDGRRLTLTVRGNDAESSMTLAWLPPDGWRLLVEQAGFDLEACYGWFDRRPYEGGEDSIWIARRT
jgi:SAM-dependent methyltransferase